MSVQVEEHPPQAAKRGNWLKRAFYKNPWIFFAVAGIILVTAIRPLMRFEPEPPPVMGALPAFALVDQDGNEVSSETLKGKVWIASFVFTTCPSVCPKVTGAMVDLQARIKRHDVPLHLVTFTVDPEYDTPEILEKYGRTYEADFAMWHFLTGSQQALESLIVGGFKTHLGDKAKNAEGLIDIAHTTKLVLVDDKGRIRGYYDSHEEGVDEAFWRAKRVWDTRER